MPNPQRLDSAPGYVAIRLGQTRLLVDALEVRDIRGAEQAEPDHASPAVLRRGGREVPIVAPAASLRALAPRTNAQIVVLHDAGGELALACDEIAVLPAGRVSVEALRPCMQAGESPVVALARVGGEPAFLCRGRALAACARRLSEPQDG
ncbi:MAG: hypothetical protein ACM3Y9_01985 [Ignavibacteria bacterium]